MERVKYVFIVANVSTGNTTLFREQRVDDDSCSVMKPGRG